eukprot:2515107-Amphidinium_carterae.2
MKTERNGCGPRGAGGLPRDLLARSKLTWTIFNSSNACSNVKATAPCLCSCRNQPAHVVTALVLKPQPSSLTAHCAHVVTAQAQLSAQECSCRNRVSAQVVTAHTHYILCSSRNCADLYTDENEKSRRN